MRRVAQATYSLLAFISYAQSTLGLQSATGFLLNSSFGVPGNQSFDYVIVGGGTAGLALAHRLSANSVFSVAVIEAGGFYEIDNGNFSQIPFFAPVGTDKDKENYNSLVDWGFATVPQEVTPFTIVTITGAPGVPQLTIGRASTMPPFITLAANVLVEALPGTSCCISVAVRSHMMSGQILWETPATSGTHFCHISRRV
jgi:hypothetical protein